MVCGPYGGPDQTRGRADGDTSARPAFLDAFGNEIFYYRYDHVTDGFNTGDNGLTDGPRPLTAYLTDPNTNTLYRRDFVLMTPGPDRLWMIRKPDLKETDDLANFVYTFEPD